MTYDDLPSGVPTPPSAPPPTLERSAKIARLERVYLAAGWPAEAARLCATRDVDEEKRWAGSSVETLRKEM